MFTKVSLHWIGIECRDCGDLSTWDSLTDEIPFHRRLRSNNLALCFCVYQFPSERLYACVPLYGTISQTDAAKSMINVFLLLEVPSSTGGWLSL